MTLRRLLMTADAVGGVWTYALELARGLTGHGVELCLVVIGPVPDASQRAEARAIAGLSLVVADLALEWQDGAGPLGADARHRLQELEREFVPELIHCNGFREAASGFAAPVLVVAHSCVATWSRACRGQELPSAWAAYADGIRAGLATADLVVAPTEAFLENFRAAWRPVPRTAVVRNGLDLEPAAGVSRQPVILAAGRLWDEAKNVGALVQVAPALSWPVSIAGEAPSGGLGDGVQHLGRLPRDELRQRMSEAAIFVAPARYEPFGLAILEAAAEGCALVLGRIPSLIELWEGAARFVAPDDPASLQAALSELTRDPDALARLQRAAAERARTLTRRRMVEGYLAAYSSILAAAPFSKVRAA